MDILLILLPLLLAILAFAIKIKFSNRPDKSSNQEHIKHSKRTHLTTESERKLFYALRKALSQDYLIHCQTSFIALVVPNEFKYKSKAWSKRMDFVITDTATKILCVIELDDATHRQEKRRKRDEYINNALSGHHPLIRLPVQRFYRPDELADIFEKKLGIPNKLNASTKNNASTSAQDKQVPPSRQS